MTWETSSPERSSSPIRLLCSSAVSSAGAFPQRRRSSASTVAVRSRHQRGRGGERRRVGGAGLGQPGLAEQGGQLGPGREVVSLRRVVQPVPGGQEHQQPGPARRPQHPAHFPQHGQLGRRAAGRAQHAQAPGLAGGAVGERQRGRVGLDHRGAEQPGGGPAGVGLRLGQDRLDPGPLGRVGGRAAQRRRRCRSSGRRAAGPGPPAASPGPTAGRCPGRPPGCGTRAEALGHLGRPLGHGAELGVHRVAAVLPPVVMRRALP